MARLFRPAVALVLAAVVAPAYGGDEVVWRVVQVRAADGTAAADLTAGSVVQVQLSQPGQVPGQPRSSTLPPGLRTAPPAAQPAGTVPITAAPPAGAAAGNRVVATQKDRYASPMLGHFPGSGTTGTVTATSLLTDPLAVSFATVTDTLRVEYPNFARIGARISDNESPEPQDRVYVTYNGYRRMPVRVTPVSSALTLNPTALNFAQFGPGPFPTQSTLIDTLTRNGPAAGTPLNDYRASSVGVNLFTLGLEKTFRDGDASLGVRLPIYGVNGGGGITGTPNAGRLAAFQAATTTATGSSGLGDLSGSAVGDVSVIGKMVLRRDEETDSLATGGLLLTLPTGRLLGSGFYGNGALFQPFVGYVRNTDGELFAQGFHSLTIPTFGAGGRVAFGNDVSLGYRIRRDGAYVSEIIPVTELHLTTPVGSGGGGGVSRNLLAFTGGAHLRLGRAATLSLGTSVPLAGSRAYQVEGLVRLNWYF